MDVLEIDAASFAGRVAHVSAAELAGLMQHGDVRPEPGWLTPGLDVAPDADMTPIVERMAAYVLERDAPGETLFRKFVGPSWPEAAAPTQMAFDLFATTVAAVGGAIVSMQRAAEAQANQPPASPAPNVEDTIFETDEPLGTLRPEAVAAQQDLAKRQAAAAKKAARRTAVEEAKAQREARGPRQRRGVAEELKGGAGKPMSAGEPPAKPPVNKGGRGRKKTA